MNAERFEGPLFIVGISRSGTKLLRDLLNNHSRISMPEIESKFIPLFYRRFGQWDETRFREQFELFFKYFARAQFYEMMKDKGITIDIDTWREQVERWTFGGVIEALFKMLARGESEKKTIWGDKTPSYLLSIPLLKTLFPRAKFIHIIRDVRDICISARKAWKRNIYFTAQRWSDYINRCRKDAASHAAGDYIEITYEELTADPGAVLEQLCGFLGIHYEHHMPVLTFSSEEFGDAKGKTEVIHDNTQKWKTQLSAAQAGKIEAICAPLLQDLGYPLAVPAPAGRPPKRLNRLRWYFNYIPESLYFLRTHTREHGFKKTFRAFLRKIKFRFK
jgi:hypothetical protein